MGGVDADHPSHRGRAATLPLRRGRSQARRTTTRDLDAADEPAGRAGHVRSADQPWLSPDGGPRELAGRLWDCEALAARADLLRIALEDVSRQAGASRLGERALDSDIAPGFMVLAACLRFLRTEPQLPAELVVSSPANELRARYMIVEAQLQERLRVLFRNGINRSPVQARTPDADQYSRAVSRRRYSAVRGIVGAHQLEAGR